MDRIWLGEQTIEYEYVEKDKSIHIQIRPSLNQMSITGKFGNIQMRELLVNKTYPNWTQALKNGLYEMDWSLIMQNLVIKLFYLKRYGS